MAGSGKMDPRPDHGENSYKGSGRLAGRKALITGGDSGMGRAAAIAYAREGADVAINYFPSEEPDAQEVIGLITAERRIGIAIPGDLRDEKFCQELVAVHARVSAVSISSSTMLRDSSPANQFSMFPRRISMRR
jgi:NAD(P)-dependent dehydrogenase (short-subunit alcohol dehydrogenase family)